MGGLRIDGQARSTAWCENPSAVQYRQALSALISKSNRKAHILHYMSYCEVELRSVETHGRVMLITFRDTTTEDNKGASGGAERPRGPELCAVVQTTGCD